MESRIDHQFIQKKWQNFWTAINAFDSTLDKSSNMLYVILQPPPNTTGKCHVGHFLNGI
jgi:valyl-tRNA synthetase